MRWPWHRNHNTDTEAAERALAEARRQRREVEAQQDRVDQLARKLAAYSQDNHFADRIRQAMGGRG